MEALSNSVEDVLIDSLQFKLSNSASYITSRNSGTFWPSGSNIYKTSSGTKVAKFVLTGDNWLDPSTVRLVFNVVNNKSTAEVLRPVSGPWCFWRRLRLQGQDNLLARLDPSWLIYLGHSADRSVRGRCRYPGVGQQSHQGIALTDRANILVRVGQ